MRAYLLGGVVAVAIVIAAGTIAAHHSFRQNSIANKPITITGIVTKVEWTNPHVWFYVNVKDAEDRRGHELGRRNGSTPRSAARRLAPRHDEDR